MQFFTNVLIVRHVYNGANTNNTTNNNEMIINQFETHILKHKTRIVVLSHNSMNTEMCEPKNIIEGSVT